MPQEAKGGIPDKTEKTINYLFIFKQRNKINGNRNRNRNRNGKITREEKGRGNFMATNEMSFEKVEEIYKREHFEIHAFDLSNSNFLP